VVGARHAQPLYVGSKYHCLIGIQVHLVQTDMVNVPTENVRKKVVSGRLLIRLDESALVKGSRTPAVH